MNAPSLKVRHLGQIESADVRFGDLTVLVGPQATGKSIFLQLLKLMLDTGAVLKEFKRFNIDWNGDIRNFLDLYFGEGMSGIYRRGQTEIHYGGQSRDLGKITTGKKHVHERSFLIPAQRVMALREGLTRPFTDYRSGDPFAVREFSERLHQLVQSEFSKGNELFPVSNRLRKEYRDKIAQGIFGGFGLKTDPRQFEKRLVLSQGEKAPSLPYLVWSAGQREFVPLLLGLYWLMPSAKISRRDHLEWVMIEELEMGLHPQAISVSMMLVLSLLQRGYRVVLSTHSPHVLDVVWALRAMKEDGGEVRDILDLFELPSNPATKALANSTLDAVTKVFYFARNGEVRDISRLDPGADDMAEAGWGGLTEFSGRVADVVSRIARRKESESCR